MGRKGIKLSKEEKAIAVANGIAIQTAYARLARGWDVKRAINTKPQSTVLTQLERSETGELKASKNPKGNLRTFAINKHLDQTLDQLITESGMNQSNFIAKIVEDYIHEQSKVV
jgi:hypothetical protein